jgi:type IV secretion system protein VirB10
MPNQDHCRRNVSATAYLEILAAARAKQIIAIASIVLVTSTCLAQDQTTSSTPPAGSAAVAPPQPESITIPANTRLALVLTNPVSTNSMHRGDVVYAQTTAPVIVGDRTVIPAGIFVQGKLDKLTRNGSRAEMLMTSASVVFPNGYVVNIVGPLTVESDEGTAWRNPSAAARTGAIIAPIAGGGLGALIGSAVHTTQSSSLGGTTLTQSTPKGLAIGSMVGLAIGGAVSLAILLNSRHFFVDVGSPMEMTLPQPLTLSASRVTDAVRQAEEHPVAAPMAAPRPLPYRSYDRGICFTPGTPGTPPTVIPGTPPIGDSPGAPATVIPGTPPTPGTPYPCN